MSQSIYEIAQRLCNLIGRELTTPTSKMLSICIDLLLPLMFNHVQQINYVPQVVLETFNFHEPCNLIGREHNY